MTQHSNVATSPKISRWWWSFIPEPHSNDMRTRPTLTIPASRHTAYHNFRQRIEAKIAGPPNRPTQPAPAARPTQTKTQTSRPRLRRRAAPPARTAFLCGAATTNHSETPAPQTAPNPNLAFLAPEERRGEGQGVRGKSSAITQSLPQTSGGTHRLQPSPEHAA